MNPPPVQYTRTADGVSIAYAVAGDGPPVIRAAVPGVSHVQKDWQVYARVLQGLASTFRIAWYDARGTGLSDLTARDWSMGAMLSDLDAVVAASGFEKFTLLGFSSWAPIALTYAARNPDRLSHLVIIDGTANAGAKTPEMEQTERATRHLLETDWNLFTEMLGKVLINYDDPDYIKAWVEHQRTCVDQQTYIAISDAIAQHDATSLLSQIAVPTLVIHNEKYRLLPTNFGQEIAAAIPGARYQAISDSLETMWQNLPGMVFDFVGGGAGGRIQTAAPSSAALRTVLFTDLVGHTEMMQRLGDAKGRDVLREHERITREVLKANGGTEVKTMGDGFMASFGSVTRAVECAIALQRAIEEWNAGVGAQHAAPLHVRVGLNAGEPIEEDGDLFGATVILASRIAAKAQGGEILVADTVRGLCSGKGFLFADRGEFVAKGFEEPVRVYEVSWRE